MRNKLHPISIFRHSYKLSLANIIGYILQIPVFLYVASRLGPENYGLVAFVMLWAFYGRLIRPGMLSAAAREMPHNIGKGEAGSAIYIQNICITYEFIYYLFASSIIIVASFFFKNPVVRIGLILVAISLLLDIIDSSYANAQWSFQRFNIITRINLFKALITPLFTFLLVFLLYTYGLLVLPVAISLFSIFYYLIFAPKLNFAITFNFKKLLPLLKVGIALQLFTFLFWTFRGIDKTFVAMWFSAKQLGLYAFAMSFIHNIYKLISDFGNVLQPIVLSELGRLGDALHVQKEFNQLIIVLTMAGCIITNLAQAGFGAMVYWFVPKFIPSIKIFEILSFNIIFTAILIVPSILLLSSLINKQKLCNIIYGIVLVMITLLAYLIVKMGVGVIGIACLFVGTQVIITISMSVVSRKYLFKNNNELFSFCLGMLAILFFAVINYSVFLLNLFRYQQGSILIPFAGRIFFTLVYWGIIIFLAYRFFTKDKILLKLFKEKIIRAQ
ncbi:oligosaccharide flippase family protein [Candidatus Omnitrophota bacterium]